MKSLSGCARVTWISLAALGLSIQFSAGARLQAGRVDRNGVIAGRLVFPDGTAAADIRVSALTTPIPAAGSSPAAQSRNRGRNSGQLLMSVARTDRDGRYRLVDIPPGRYFIVAGSLDAPAYFPGVLTEAAATLITLSAGQTLNATDFRLAGPDRRISGRVYRDGHDRGTDVVLENTSRTYSAPIDRNNMFVFPGVPPGRYNVRVTPNIGPLGLRIVVADRDIPRLEVPVPRSAVTGGLLTVRVSANSGAAQPKIQVRLTQAGSPSPAAPLKKTVTVSSGTTMIEVPPGEYLVEAALIEPLANGHVIRSIDEDRKRGLRQPLRITTTTLIRIMVGPPLARE
ncbi:MAG TPA: carboxypeptidase-like regulatory domain-containing protein [Terriglobia bacterium]|nr:carboxypeptidase-like regulatory domain-containing protein [Terriglobia bacterium]